MILTLKLVTQDQGTMTGKEAGRSTKIMIVLVLEVLSHLLLLHLRGLLQSLAHLQSKNPHNQLKELI